MSIWYFLRLSLIGTLATFIRLYSIRSPRKSLRTKKCGSENSKEAREKGTTHHQVSCERRSVPLRCLIRLLLLYTILNDHSLGAAFINFSLLWSPIETVFGNLMPGTQFTDLKWHMGSRWSSSDYQWFSSWDCAATAEVSGDGSVKMLWLDWTY